MKSKITYSNIKAYLQGKIRYKLYYNKYFNWLIPLHIFEQIAYRIFVMDKECYAKGSCTLCGCDTTALQMADKACDKPCYPAMMDETDWMIFKIKEDINFRYYNSKKPREFELRITLRTAIG